MPTYDASDAEISVFVRRDPEAMLSSMGHDVKLSAKAFEIEVDVSGREVSAAIDASSLEPVDAIKWTTREPTGELSDGDRHEIAQRIDRDVLEVGEHPEISFESTEVRRTDEGFSVEGTLELHGERGDLGLDVERRGDRLRMETTFNHTEWGVDPYSAMLGSLKVDPEIAVAAELPVPEDLA